MIITRFDGGYLVKIREETIILTDEELRVAKVAEDDEIKPAFYGSRESRLEHRDAS